MTDAERVALEVRVDLDIAFEDLRAKFPTSHPSGPGFALGVVTGLDLARSLLEIRLAKIERSIEAIARAERQLNHTFGEAKARAEELKNEAE